MVLASSGANKKSRVTTTVDSGELENNDANPLRVAGFITIESFAESAGLPVKSIIALARSKKGGIIEIFDLAGRDVADRDKLTTKFKGFVAAKTISNAEKLQRAKQISATKTYIVKLYLANRSIVESALQGLASEKKLKGAYFLTMMPGAPGTGQAPLVKDKIKNVAGEKGLLTISDEIRQYKEKVTADVTSDDENAAP